MDAALADLPPPALVPPRRRASMPLWATVGGMVFTAGLGALVTIGIMDAPTSSAAGPTTDVSPNEAHAAELATGAGPPPPLDIPTSGSGKQARLPEDRAVVPVDANAATVVPRPAPLAVGGGASAVPESPPPLDIPTSGSGEQARPPEDRAVVPVDANKVPMSESPARMPSAKRLTWKTVERAVQRRAQKFRKCSTEDAITLGLQVRGGHVVLTSFDGKPATVHHQCARDVLDSLRLSATRTLSGVVAVILE